MSRPLVRQTTADDFDQVATRTEELLAEFAIDSDKLVDVEIAPFGSHRWLILVSYFGTYVNKTWIGLSSVVGRALEMAREVSAAAGMLVVQTRSFGAKRTFEAATGLVTSAARAIECERTLSASLGIVSIANQWSYSEFLEQSGLTATVAREHGAVRPYAPPTGLVVDVSYTHYHP